MLGEAIEPEQLGYWPNQGFIRETFITNIHKFMYFGFYYC